MNSRTRLNLGLLGLVAVLAGLAWWQPGLESGAPTERLTELAAAEIEHVRIERQGGEPLALERVDGHWWMREPLDAPANEFRLELLLQLTSEASHARYDAREVDLTELGLERPAARVYLGERELAFGTTAPIDGRRYVLVGETVHLVADRHFHLLSAETAEFVSTRLLPHGARVRALQLPDWQLARSEEGRWQLSPADPGLSADAAPLLARSWEEADAVWVQPYEPTEALDEIKVQVEDRDTPLHFALLSRHPELVLKPSDLPLQFHFPEEAARWLLEPAVNTDPEWVDSVPPSGGPGAPPPETGAGHDWPELPPPPSLDE
jgi:hypothetical protein